MPSLFDTERHSRLISLAAKALKRHDEVLLVWLEGTLALGTADRYADVDLHVAVADDDLDVFCAHRVQVARQLGDVVLMREDVGPTPTLVVLYGIGVALRLTAEKLSQIVSRPREIAKVLVDTDNYTDDLDIAPRPQLSQEFQRERVTKDISEFWLCVWGFPRAVRRGCPVALCQSHISLLRALLARMMMAGTSRDTTAPLTPQEIDELESTADRGAAILDTWFSLVRVSQLFSAYARKACRGLGLRYPEEVEASVRAYVYSELADRLPAGDWWKP